MLITVLGTIYFCYKSALLSWVQIFSWNRLSECENFLGIQRIFGQTNVTRCRWEMKDYFDGNYNETDQYLKRNVDSFMR